MNLLDMLTSAQGGGAMRELGQQFDLDQTQTQQAVKQLLPAISGGLRRNTESQGGLQSLLSALQGGRHERYLDEPGQAFKPESVEDGNAILGHLFGSFSPAILLTTEFFKVTIAVALGSSRHSGPEILA